MICEFHITLTPRTPFDYYCSNSALQNFRTYPVAISTAGEGARERGCARYCTIHQIVKNSLYKLSQRAVKIDVSSSEIVCLQGLKH